MKKLGAILAGGKSTRFGGDKGAALLDGIALIDHVVSALSPACEEIVIVGREWPGLTSLEDKPAPDMGPLGGLCAALFYAREHGFEMVVTAGCDMMPVVWLAEDVAPFGRAAVIDGHYLAGIWPAELALPLSDYLKDTDDLSMRGWIAFCEAKLVPPSTEISNLNSLEDLRIYEKSLIDR